MLIIMFKALFQRVENCHPQDTSSLTTLLLLALQKTRVPVFLVEMKFKELFKWEVNIVYSSNFLKLLYGSTYRLKPSLVKLRPMKPE